LLQESNPFQKAETCYLAAASSSFDEGLEIVTAHGHEQKFVVPNLLLDY
jgi:sirohydrochlorin ferrochelatase